jgi:hypothetical protein
VKNHQIILIMGFALLFVFSILIADQYFEKMPDKTIPCNQTIFERAREHNTQVMRLNGLNNQFAVQIGLGGAGNQVLVECEHSNTSNFLNNTIDWASKYKYVDSPANEITDFQNHLMVIRTWTAFPAGAMYNYTYITEAYRPNLPNYAFKFSNDTAIVLYGDPLKKMAINLFFLIIGWLSWIFLGIPISKKISSEA